MKKCMFKFDFDYDKEKLLKESNGKLLALLIIIIF